jgi:hypothetical protein
VWLYLSVKGCASTHFENGHTATPSVVSPFFPGGSNLVTKSIAQSRNGALPFQLALMQGKAVNLALST